MSQSAERAGKVNVPKPKNPRWKVPYFDLQLGDLEKEAVLGVLEDSWLTMGPRITRFEGAFAEALQAPNVEAVAVTNCTAALHLALVALGVGPGDEVICPSLTFVADANAIVQTGARPVFADVISEDDWTVDPADIAAKITPRTKAVIPVHYAGYACRMDEIMELAARHQLRVLEDAAHAPLAEYKGRKLGTIGDIGCFSFFSNKNMTTGEGGMLVSSTPELIESARALRSHGMTTSSYQRFRGHAFAYDVVTPGFNYRMDEIRAALGLVQLAKLPDATAARRNRVLRYRNVLRERLAMTPSSDKETELRFPFADHDGVHGYHAFPVLLPTYMNRASVMKQMADRGVQTSIHYRPIHSFIAYCDDAQGPTTLPVTDALAMRILSLPLFPNMTDEQIDLVVDALQAVLTACGKD